MTAGLVGSLRHCSVLNQLQVFSSVFILTWLGKKPILRDLERPSAVVCSEDTESLPSENCMCSIINNSSAHCKHSSLEEGLTHQQFGAVASLNHNEVFIVDYVTMQSTVTVICQNDACLCSDYDCSVRCVQKFCPFTDFLVIFSFSSKMINC